MSLDAAIELAGRNDAALAALLARVEAVRARPTNKPCGAVDADAAESAAA